jgi:hypothetical protein
MTRSNPPYRSSLRPYLAPSLVTLPWSALGGRWEGGRQVSVGGRGWGGGRGGGRGEVAVALLDRLPCEELLRGPVGPATMNHYLGQLRAWQRRSRIEP